MSHPTRDIVRSLSPDERLVLSGSLYFTDDDWLRLDSYNTAASVTLTVSGIMINPAGAIVPFSFTQVPATDRTVTTTRFRLGECFLIHATVRATAGTVRRGQCFTVLMGQRWEGTGGLVFATLLSDYVSTAFFPVWPGGVMRNSVEPPGIIRYLNQANPAAGADVFITVPTGALWKFRTLNATFTTSATAATRTISFSVDDGTTIYFEVIPSITVTASLARLFRMGVLQGYEQPTIQNSRLSIGLPELILPAAHRFYSNTGSLQTDDAWTAINFTVEEWLNP